MRSYSKKNINWNVLDFSLYFLGNGSFIHVLTSLIHDNKTSISVKKSKSGTNSNRILVIVVVVVIISIFGFSMAYYYIKTPYLMSTQHQESVEIPKIQFPPHKSITELSKFEGSENEKNALLQNDNMKNKQPKINENV